MALSLSALKKTSDDAIPPLLVAYGVPGVGKTRLGSEFPDPIYVNTSGEEPPDDVEMATPGQIETIDDLYGIIGELLSGGHDRKTLVVDSADGLEPLVWAEACARNGWANIEEPGFGKGYAAADPVWREILDGFHALRRAGMAVVLIAHTDITRFDSPTTDPYSRYGIKLQKRANGLVIEAASAVGFMNYRMTLKEKDAGFGKKTSHGEGGGDRQINFEERPGYIAKNRHGLPSTVPFKKDAGYTAIAKYIVAPTGVANDNAGEESAAA